MSSRCRSLLPLLLLGALAASPVWSQERLGTIDFPTSGTSPAQEQFLLGALLLHSFEFERAATAFRRAQVIDSSFVMAYWGEAMTHNHPLWKQQDRDAAREILERLGPTAEVRHARAQTQREAGYLRAVEVLYGDGAKNVRDTLYSAAMEDLVNAYPDDDEARAFYALSILGLDDGDRQFTTYMRAASIAQQVFDRNRDHPGAVHYLIHSFDDPIHAPLGLTAARAYAEIAPGAAHAQHMTSHIFTAMGMWDNVVAANERAWEVSGRRNGHYTHWLEYGYLQQGRHDDALRYLQAVYEEARERRTPSLLSYFARMRAHYLVETGDWDGPAAKMTLAFEPGARPAAFISYADGWSAVHTGRIAEARTSLESMDGFLATLSGTIPETAFGQMTVSRDILEARIRFTEGDSEAGLRIARRAAERESSLPFEFGPPPTVKPPQELVGDMLLRLEKPRDAVTAYRESLVRTPNRAHSLLGLTRAALQAGSPDLAKRHGQALEQLWRHAPTLFEPREQLRTLLDPADGS